MREKRRGREGARHPLHDAHVLQTLSHGKRQHVVVSLEGTLAVYAATYSTAARWKNTRMRGSQETHTCLCLVQSLYALTGHFIRNTSTHCFPSKHGWTAYFKKPYEFLTQQFLKCIQKV